MSNEGAGWSAIAPKLVTLQFIVVLTNRVKHKFIKDNNEIIV